MKPNPFIPLEHPEIEESYPTEATLETIRQWPAFDWKRLFQFLHEANIYSGCGYCHLSEDGAWLQFSTGGWSGNESLISAMKEGEGGWRFGFLLFAQVTGGHYLFRLPGELSHADLHSRLVDLLQEPVKPTPTHNHERRATNC